MKIYEFGQEHDRTFVLFQCAAEPWWAFQGAAQAVAQDFHVFLVIADGHDEQGTTFVSIEKNVSDVAAYLRARGIQHLDCLYGVSMGGATTMMVSGDETPEYVKAFVDDCGYTSVWDQFTNNMEQTFPWMPAKKAILNSASNYCQKHYGWNFKEASSVDQLAKSTKPMLFIHGENDDFVLTEMVYKNYEAKVKGYKEIWIAPGSAHAMAYKDHPAEYTKHVRDFLATVKKLQK